MMRRQQQQQSQHDYQSKMLYELSALVLNIMRSIEFSDESPPERNNRTLQQITPSGFASLLLGISLALMLCGSVTFFIGFILMPWVIGFVVFLYFVGLISSISMIGKAILSCNSPPPPSPSPSKDVPSWKLL